jgi:hypothetical protein
VVDLAIFLDYRWWIRILCRRLEKKVHEGNRFARQVDCVEEVKRRGVEGPLEQYAAFLHASAQPLYRELCRWLTVVHLPKPGRAATACVFAGIRPANDPELAGTQDFPSQHTLFAEVQQDVQLLGLDACQVLTRIANDPSAPGERGIRVVLRNLE